MEAFEYSQLSPSKACDSQSTDCNQQYFQDENNRYHCTFPDCGKIFKFRSEVTRHNVIHYNNRPFVCHYEDCGKSFKRADALDAHLHLHEKDLPYQCSVPGCNKRFATKAILKYHILKHNDDRVFACSFPGCDRTFFTKGQLKQHEKAFTYHMNLAKQSIKQEEIAKAPLSNPSTDATEYYEDSVHSTDHSDHHQESPASPSFIPNLDWEMSSESEKAGENIVKIEDDDRDSFESIVKYILKDNNVVEKKEHFIDDEPNFFMSNNQWSQPILMESNFMDENEFKLFNFLKEQQFNSF